MLSSLTPAQIHTYLADRQARSYNLIWPSVLCNEYCGNVVSGTSPSTMALADGTPPFTSGSNENSYDYTTPNNAYWTEIDNLVIDAANFGMVLALDPFDTGLGVTPGDPSGTSFKCDNNYPGELVGARSSGVSKMTTYGNYLGTRYKNYPNIMWIIGNDFQSVNCTTGSSGNDAALVAAIMNGIKSTDPNHFISLEANYQYSYSSQNSTISPYITLNGVYTFGGVYDQFYQAENASSIPAFLIETNYEYDNDTGALSPWPEGPPPCSGAPPCSAQSNTMYDYIVRLTNWWSMTSGAAGVIPANYYENDAPFPTGWQAGIDSNGSTQIQYLASFFNSLASWQTMAADQGRTVVTSGYGTYCGGVNGTTGNGTCLDQVTNNYVTTIWNASHGAVIYDPAGLSLTVNMASFSNALTAQWYDPTKGIYTTVSGSPFANSGSHTFSTPGNNSRGVSDWVLLLQVSGSASGNGPTGANYLNSSGQLEAIWLC
jgi:hypothetical protein